MPRAGCALSVSAAILLFSLSCLAQPPDSQTLDNARPKIGLVLSGGGARGGVHIGVLRALEELRVPIDYIAGTSIGAIVGGFYASGMSVDEIEQVVDGLNWDAAFMEATPRQLRSFRRKRDDDLFLVDQRPGLNEGEFELPIGLVQGQVIDLILSRHTLPVAHVNDFDELPIPFRAVAADLVTGEAVVLPSGVLARAIRASMSVPAFFAPVEIGGRLLVDGGIAMNLPVEVIQAMGAEVIIAVDLTTPLLSRDEIGSVLDVTVQLTNLLTRTGVSAQIARLGAADVYLKPELPEDFNSASFQRMAEVFSIGYETVMANTPAFRALRVSEGQYGSHVAGRPDPRKPKPPVVEFVRLENNSNIDDQLIQARLRDIELGETLDFDAVDQAVSKVYGLELFQNVRYEVVTEGDRTGLEIELHEREWGPDYLQLGLEYSSSADEDALFGLAASFLSTAVNEKAGEWRATLVVGDQPALLADFYQPFGDDGLFFFAPALNFESNVFNVFDNGTSVADVKLRQGLLELGVGREFPSWGEFRAGLRAATGDTKLTTGDPAFIPEDRFRKGEFFTRFSVDTIDSVAFPTSGALARVEWRGSRPDSLSADVQFDQMLLDASYARTWGRHTLLTSLRYDATISGTAPVSSLLRMGGFFDLSGFNENQLTGQHAARLGAGYYRRIGDLALFPAFAGFNVEVGNVWDARSDIGLGDAIWGGSFWAGVDTPVGPIYVGYGTAEGGENAFYVFLGSPF